MTKNFYVLIKTKLLRTGQELYWTFSDVTKFQYELLTTESFVFNILRLLLVSTHSKPVWPLKKNTIPSPSLPREGCPREVSNTKSVLEKF